MAQQGTDLDNMRSTRGERKRIDDTITLFKFPEKKWVTLRFHEAFFTYAGYWVQTKGKDGKKGKPFFVDAPSYDPQTQQRDSEKYDPWRDLDKMEYDAGVERANKTLNFTIHAYTNAILRASQKNEPHKKTKATKEERTTGFKDKDSDSWTPNVVVRLTPSVVGKIREQAGLNVVETKGQTKAFAVTHKKYGCDVRIMYDSSKAPADQYTISIGARSPLTEEELAYLKWDLSDLVSVPKDSETKANFDSYISRSGIKMKKSKSKSDEDEDDDEDDEPKKSKSKSKKSKSEPEEDDDEDDEDDEDEDDEDDEDEDEDDEEPVKKGKKSKSEPKKSKGKKSKSEPEDDDDFDDDFEDDDEEDDEDEDDDDEPKKSKSKGKKSKSKGKKKSKSDDDEDEDDDDFGDDDDDEDDDEDDEPVKKSKKSKKSKSKSDDDEDDDFEDEDEDDDEEPKKSKKSKSKSKKSKSKGKKKSDDDDDDEDDDDEDFDD